MCKTLRSAWPTLILFAVVGNAAIILQPAGLQPGDTYQLVFITAGTINATSTNIGTYNAFVEAEAANNPDLAAFTSSNGLTWTAIGSTSSIQANANAPSSGRVYTLDGLLVASVAEPLYVGDGNDTLLSPITISQFGNYIQSATWTGNYLGGSGSGGHELGSNDPNFGYSTYLTRAWEFYAAGSVFGYTPSTTLPMYALSSEITVVPEPGTFALVILCAVAILHRHRRRQ